MMCLASARFRQGALLHTYMPPEIARVLVRTGRLVTDAAHRAMESKVWNTNVNLPGGLIRGRPGYIATVQVRMLHAQIRATNLRRGRDVEAWGAPSTR
jgi:hypothetical protein